ncbi:annulin [Anthonomus grandis grandis]|uniref:annulin n=1 Tax=Anthonomus grandis grandis TaxID=2921223 RepID=UPI0021652A51|nr:annulin [Anthonomus grandis grandis]
MRRRLNCCPRRFPWFRSSWSPKHDVPLQPLPKPESPTDEVVDNTPFEEKIKEPDILVIRSIDPCIEENGLHHRTGKYELMSREYFPQLVVRRGQHFKLNITLSRPYDESRDGISFIFVVEDEEKPLYGNGTMVAVPLLHKPDRHLPWNVVIHSVSEDVLSVNVLTSPDTIVAKWKMDVDTRIINNGAYSYSWESKIYILFNPWSRHDQVFMKSDEWREEAVMNDVGIVYRGTYNRIKPVIWKYDQFEKNILDCAIYLVHVVGKVKGNYRSDPVKITRALAAAVNSADDEGAVMGNWSTDHSGGTAPTKWIGSMEILQKYYKKKKPVKYGQCWVFSGVLTTICRALGIPARTVTNYSSAHDTQNSLTVDYFMDEKGSVMEELNSDSVWNFHVWNEVWMTRPDLGREYSGWQAIDATPQELSEDIYRCGPASVVAVKDGEILRPHDTNFLFAEVNADKIFWRWNGPTQPLKLLRKDVYGIGKLICTKAPGTFDREDITYTYKYSERSTEERNTMLKALKQSESLFSRYYLNEDFNDIYFHFNLLDDVKIGQPFDVSLAMRNRSTSKSYKVSVILRVDVVTYTGKIGDSIKKEQFSVIVKPSSTHKVKLAISYDEYGKRVIDQCAFNVSCLASIEDTKFEYYAQDDFRIRKPDIKINLRDTPIENTEVTADISVENPLPVPLKRGEFTIEAPGIEGKLKLKVKAVPPGEEATGEFKFTPPRTGRFAVAAKFVCKEMDDVDGFVMILVEPRKEQNGVF